MSLIGLIWKKKTSRENSCDVILKDLTSVCFKGFYRQLELSLEYLLFDIPPFPFELGTCNGLKNNIC